jgi:hypothetical protein
MMFGALLLAFDFYLKENMVLLLNPVFFSNLLKNKI